MCEQPQLARGEIGLSVRLERVGFKDAPSMIDPFVTISVVGADGAPSAPAAAGPSPQPGSAACHKPRPPAAQGGCWSRRRTRRCAAGERASTS